MRDLAYFLFDCAFHLVNGALDLILGTRFHSLLLVASVCKITSAQGRRRSNAGRARVRPKRGNEEMGEMGRHHLLYEVRRSPFEELAQNGHSLEHAAQG